MIVNLYSPSTFPSPKHNPFPSQKETLEAPLILRLLSLSLSRLVRKPLPHLLSSSLQSNHPPMSSSSQNTPDQFLVDCFCGVRSPLRTALTNENVGRRFLGCVNYHKGPDEKCKFFEWVNPETCARVKEFGRWIVKKNMDLQNKLADLGKKLEKCKRSEEWFAVKVSSMKNEMKEMEDGFKLKMEEWQKREDWYAVKREEVEAKNADLRKKIKVLKEKAESGKWKVKVLTAMVLAMVAIMVVFFCGEGMWKRKMLALP